MMTYGELAKHLAVLLKERLSDEEYAWMVDIMGDDATDLMLYRALRGLPVLPV